MKVSSSIVSFRIDIDFEKSDVDMVYNEMRARGVTTPVPSLIISFEADGGFGRKPKKFKLKGNQTPTEASVDFCLQWLSGFVDREEMCTTSGRSIYDKNKPITELEELGIEVTSTDGLMMGCCHLICEVDSKLYSNKLVKKANEIVYEVEGYIDHQSSDVADDAFETEDQLKHFIFNQDSCLTIDNDNH